METRLYKVIDFKDGVNGVIDLTDYTGYYHLVPLTSTRLTSPWTLSATGTPVEGASLVIHFFGGMDTASNSVTILGQKIPDAVFLSNNRFIITAVYYDSGWEVFVTMDLAEGSGTITSTYLGALSVGTANIVALAVTPSKLSTGGVAGKIYIDSGAAQVLQAISGDATLSATGVLTIGASKVTPSKLITTLRKELIPVPLTLTSTGVFGTTIPYDCTVDKVTFIANKAGTSEAGGNTLLLQNEAGTTMTGSTAVLGASTAIAVGDEFGAYTITGNNTIAAGEQIHISVGGSAATTDFIANIEITRT